MWYVIQTITGKEKELATAINRALPGEYYEKCFVIWQEVVRRREGAYQVEVRPLFPSYVFIETEQPKELFLSLRQFPGFAKLLGSELLENEEEFWPVREEEKTLLCRMAGQSLQVDVPTYLVRRSNVRVNEEGEITDAEGFLGEHLDRIVKKRLRKRSVTIEIPFLGETRRIQLGIRVVGVDEE